MEIRNYIQSDELGWLQCRVLSFLNTAYYDNVLNEKEKYDNPSIEIVAIEKDKVIGLLDIEYEVEGRTVCSRGKGLGGMIWHIAVHPDFQKRGIGGKLLRKAEKTALAKGLNRLEAWTRDDVWVNNWYEKQGFINVRSYLQVYINGGQEVKKSLKSEIEKLYPVQAFAHYTGDDKEMIRGNFKRVHECNCYEKKIW